MFPRFEVYKTRRIVEQDEQLVCVKEWRWRFRAKNGRIIAVSSEGYKRKASAIHGIGLVLDMGATIVDVVE